MIKSLSAGFVPVGAVAMIHHIMVSVLNCMDRAVVHGSIFSNSYMAMTAGLAGLEVIKTENLIENSAKVGEDIIYSLSALAAKYEFLKEVRGKGSMIAIEFKSPNSLSPKTARAMLEAANKGYSAKWSRFRCLKNTEF